MSRQLSWSHFIIVCSIDDELKRDFYAEMCIVQKWSVRTFQKQRNGMLYERIALSKKPEEVIKLQLDELKDKDEITPDLVFKAPYFLNFIGAHACESEEELESLILNNITDFLQELGTDFCFVARQKRMSTRKIYLSDLKMKFRDKILLIADECNIESIKIFGSTAREDATEESDVDFLISVKKNSRSFRCWSF